MAWENLMEETARILEHHGKTPGDVLWVEDEHSHTSWGEFAKQADFDYESGFGLEYVNPDLTIVGKGFWLERRTYDGAEDWEYMEQPTKPHGNKGEIRVKEYTNEGQS